MVISFSDFVGVFPELHSSGGDRFFPRHRTKAGTAFPRPYNYIGWCSSIKEVHIIIEALQAGSPNVVGFRLSGKPPDEDCPTFVPIGSIWRNSRSG